MAAITTAAYPVSRTKRAGGPPATTFAEVTTPPTPRSRTFPFVFRAESNSRNSFSTPSLRGPVILHQLMYKPTNVSDPVVSTMEIGWSPTPIRELNVPLATPRGYTLLTELLDPNNLADNPAGAGFLNSTFRPFPIDGIVELNMLIDAPEIYVVIAVPINALIDTEFRGVFNLTENVSREALSFFH